MRSGGSIASSTARGGACVLRSPPLSSSREMRGSSALGAGGGLRQPCRLPSAAMRNSVLLFIAASPFCQRYTLDRVRQQLEHSLAFRATHHDLALIDAHDLAVCDAAAKGHC